MMSDLTNLVLASAVVCTIIALGVWLAVTARMRAGRASAENDDGGFSQERSGMRAHDWGNALVNVVVGVLIGILIAQLSQLLTTALWPLAVLVPILLGGVLFFDGFIDRLVDRIFPSGIRPARKSAVRRRLPLPRRLSLPAGIVFGIGLAWLQLDKALLELI